MLYILIQSTHILAYQFVFCNRQIFHQLFNYGTDFPSSSWIIGQQVYLLCNNKIIYRRPKSDCFISFGVQRRSFIGYTLAMSQLLFFFSFFLHSFDIRLTEGMTNQPELDGTSLSLQNPFKHSYFKIQ